MNASLPVLSDERRATFDAWATEFLSQVRLTEDKRGRPPAQFTKQFMRRHHIALLGEGFRRSVFAVAEGALKIDRDFWGEFLHNRDEALLWLSAPADVTPHLVPVIAHADNYRWLLMPHVQVGGELPLEAQRALTQLGVRDFNTGNVTVDGKLLDYSQDIQPFPMSWLG